MKGGLYISISFCITVYNPKTVSLTLNESVLTASSLPPNNFFAAYVFPSINSPFTITDLKQDNRKRRILRWISS